MDNIRSGQQIDNYRLIHLLGIGGYGEVYLAEHIYRKTQVAIKILPQLTGNDLQGFLTEARTFRLKHPNIIPILDFGIEKQTPFIVMEYAPNGNLRQRHPKGTLVPLPLIVSYVRQVASALQFAHDDRLIHRDVKPENMLVGKRKEILLSDFGVATIAHGTASQRKEGVVGTVSYMAPEQIQAHVRPASDQYALGIVVYEWLCGRRPFDGAFTEIAIKHTMISPPSLRGIVPDISPEIEQVVLTALAKDPQQRFANVKAFAIALEQASQMAQARPVLPTPIPTTIDQSQQAPARGLEMPFARQTRQTPPANMPPMSLSQQLPVVAPPISPSPQMASKLPGSAPMPNSQSRPARIAKKSMAINGHRLLKRFQSSYQPPSDPQNMGRYSKNSRHSSIGNQIYPYIRAVFNRLAVLLRSEKASSTPMHIPELTRRGISRRMVMLGGVGIVGLAVVGGSAATLISFQRRNTLAVIKHPTPIALVQKPSPVLIATIYKYTGHTSDVNAVAWSLPDGKRIASGSADGTVQVWDANNGINVFTYKRHSIYVYTVAWSPDGKRIASGSADSTVQVWDSDIGGNIFTYNGHIASVYTVAWSPNGKRIASGSADGTVQVWDADNGGNVFTYKGHSRPVRSVAWSPDGLRIASGGDDGTVQIWDASNGSNVFTYKGHTDPVLTVAWSPDELRIASGSADSTAQVWDPSNGDNSYTYRIHTRSVLTVAWSPDGKRIASGSADDTVQIWDPSNGSNIFTYKGHTSDVKAAAWSPDGKRIASGGSDNTVQIWAANN